MASNLIVPGQPETPGPQPPAGPQLQFVVRAVPPQPGQAPEVVVQFVYGLMASVIRLPLDAAESLQRQAPDLLGKAIADARSAAAGLLVAQAVIKPDMLNPNGGNPRV